MPSLNAIYIANINLKNANDYTSFITNKFSLNITSF